MKKKDKKRYCIGCGKAFNPNMNNKYYCSKECWEKHNRRNYYRKKAKRCNWCGRSFTGKGECCSSSCDINYTAHMLSQKRCRLCEFSHKISGGKVLCDYINVMGHSRGCDAYNCTKFRRR